MDNILIVDIKAALQNSPRPTLKTVRLTPSAVLIPIIERDEKLHVLLTKRSENLRHHPGQISFPGGRQEASDKNLIETALRETEEEVGINQSSITVLGKLELQPTISGFMVQPIVGIVQNDIKLTLDENEVSEAFEAPLDFILNPTNWKKSYREFNGQTYPVYSILYQEKNIWGVTTQILVNFAKLLGTYQSLAKQKSGQSS